MKQPAVSISNRRLGDAGPKIIGPAGIIGIGGVGAAMAIAKFSSVPWDVFLRSYLMAFTVVLSICLGALFFVILQHAVKAGWSVVLRRIAEGVASNLTWIWILFLPILIPMLMGKTHLYHWMHPIGDEVLEAKAAYFFGPNAIHVDAATGEKSLSAHLPWFWLLRVVLFFGIWAFLAKFYVGRSVAQDASGDVSLTRRMEAFAPAAMLMFGLSLAFGSMDFVMTLEPHWFSTMFPVYFFAASCCGYFSVQILLMNLLQRSGRLTSEITPEHYQDAGKLLFAFGVVFWAYIAFSQYMLIWYANIPEETPWYMARQIGGWGWVSLLLLFGHFVGPFVILISRHPKRRAATLAGAAAWMLFMHIVDIFWLVMPRVPSAIHHAASYRELAHEVAANMAIGRGNPGFDPALDVGFGWSLYDIALVAGMLGLLAMGTFMKLAGVALIPERDPRLHESLAFENI